MGLLLLLNNDLQVTAKTGIREVQNLESPEAHVFQI